MIQLNSEQQSALNAMMAGHNVFLTGEAGTGKSTVLREFRRQCNRACAVLAPTGVAAINVGGSTIHSFFMLKPGLMTEDTIDEIGSGKKRAVIRATKTIIIDEISMVRSDVFAAIDIRLRSLARGGNREKDRKRISQARVWRRLRLSDWLVGTGGFSQRFPQDDSPPEKRHEVSLGSEQHTERRTRCTDHSG